LFLVIDIKYVLVSGAVVSEGISSKSCLGVRTKEAKIRKTRGRRRKENTERERERERENQISLSNRSYNKLAFALHLKYISEFTTTTTTASNYYVYYYYYYSYFFNADDEFKIL